MPTYDVELKDLAAHVERKLKAMAESVPTALALTAQQGAYYIQNHTVPIAFAELKDSITAQPHDRGAQISADAPHAAAVEVGSRPHFPPIEPLIRWVKLRGMQGITKRGKIRIAPKMRAGDLNPRRIARMQAFQVATALKGLEETNQSLGVESPEVIAREIQQAIGRHGTKPYRYMFRAIPEIVKLMAKNIKQGFQQIINNGP